MFLQENPFEHLQSLVGWRSNLTEEEVNKVINKIDTEINDKSEFTSFYQVIYNVPNLTNGVNTKETCLKYYGENHNFFTVSPGAQYIVPKKYILSRPLSFWKNLHYGMYSEVLNGYCQEQLWYLSFMGKMNNNFGNHDIEKKICLKKFSMNHTPYSYFM